MIVTDMVPGDDPTIDPPKGSKGRLENVILVEVTGFAMEKVERGECYEIDSATWDLMP